MMVKDIIELKEVANSTSIKICRLYQIGRQDKHCNKAKETKERSHRQKIQLEYIRGKYFWSETKNIQKYKISQDITQVKDRSCNARDLKMPVESTCKTSGIREVKIPILLQVKLHLVYCTEKELRYEQ